LNPFIRGAPGPGDSHPGLGGGSLSLVKDGTPRRLIRADDEDENDGGGCGCFPVSLRKEDL